MNILNFKDTGKLIKSIRTRAANLDKDIHVAGCSALAHYQQHNDASLLTSLVKAVSSYNPKTGAFDGRSVRGADLRGWIVEHANVKWSKKAYAKQGGYIMDTKADAPVVQLDHAIETPFYTAKESVSPDFYDVDMDIKALDALIKRVSNRIDKEKYEGAAMARATVLCNALIDARNDMELKGTEVEAFEVEALEAMLATA